MAKSLRDIRQKMKAIKSTRQVTKAMELVAASKMRRATQNAQMLRRYAATASRILENIAEVHPDLHPYLTERPHAKVLAVLFTSDRGLCGSLNAQLFRATGAYVRSLKNLSSFQSLEWIAVGRKGQQFLARTGEQVSAVFPALSNHPTFQDVLPIVRIVTSGFLEGKYDQVVLVYTDFVSALLQEPTVNVLLPFSKTSLKEMLASLLPHRKPLPATSYPYGPEGPQGLNGQLPAVKEYLFEPSQNELLKAILPQLTEVQVYQAVLEAAASEHSARMVAMRNASDNASDILDDLTLTANQTRQAAITAELSELSATKAALES